ncbi:hypothetical protein DY000_02043153 [Brassica cretica]|uniref:Uncharacterized protein n=1 Tax=Brassica cretica TaxID=69181 RepID=A0ABQ7BFX2_BRACR|nr:hypothetical protein DY000_02043153 [Brassica cretica]
MLGSKSVTTELTSKSPKKKNAEKLLRQILFRNRFFFTKSFAEETRIIGQELEKDRYAATKHVLRSVATQRPNTCSARSLRSDRVRAKAQSLRSDQTSILLGRYVTTELEQELGRYVETDLEPKFGRYVATELFRNINTTSVHAFSSTLRCYFPNTVANPSHVPRHF